MSETKGILAGVEALVDDWLGLSFKAKGYLYRHKKAAQELSKRTAIPPATNLLKAAIEQIEDNWQASNRTPSEQNWRFQPRPFISKENTSREVILERSIIQAKDPNWANQVPTSSGLIGDRTDKVRNIDLVQKNDEGNYTLIELKVRSNTPLFAAIEIVMYGLLLIWSKRNTEALGYDESSQPVLAAKSIQLCVLAPGDYYTGLDLSHLSATINQGFEECESDFEIPCSFSFTKFGSDFDEKGTPVELLQSAINREQVWDRK